MTASLLLSKTTQSTSTASCLNCSYLKVPAIIFVSVLIIDLGLSVLHSTPQTIFSYASLFLMYDFWSTWEFWEMFIYTHTYTYTYKHTHTINTRNTHFNQAITQHTNMYKYIVTECFCEMFSRSYFCTSWKVCPQIPLNSSLQKVEPNPTQFEAYFRSAIECDRSEDGSL